MQGEKLYKLTSTMLKCLLNVNSCLRATKPLLIKLQTFNMSKFSANTCSFTMCIMFYLSYYSKYMVSLLHKQFSIKVSYNYVTLRIANYNFFLSHIENNCLNIHMNHCYCFLNSLHSLVCKKCILLT